VAGLLRLLRLLRQGTAAGAGRDGDSVVETDVVMTEAAKPNLFQYIGYCYLGVDYCNL
jgi:hypothetical protein